MKISQLRDDMTLVDSNGEWWTTLYEDGVWWLINASDRFPNKEVNSESVLAGFRPYRGTGRI